MASVYAARLQGKHGFRESRRHQNHSSALAGDARLEKMFLDEASIVSKIRHPHVAEVSM